jgi:hypothetical protein
MIILMIAMASMLAFLVDRLLKVEGHLIKTLKLLDAIENRLVVQEVVERNRVVP